MALSSLATRALQQVELGLLILYEEGYFSKDSWIQMDGLIHRGQYIFTEGPPDHLLDEPMMFFESSKQEAKGKAISPPAADYLLGASPKNVIVEPEDQISTLDSSELAESGETGSRSSVESFSDQEKRVPTAPKAMSMFGASNAAMMLSLTETAESHLKLEHAKAGFSENSSQGQPASSSGAQKYVDQSNGFAKGREFYPQASANVNRYHSPSSNDAEIGSALPPKDKPISEGETRIHLWSSKLSPKEAPLKLGSLAQSRWNEAGVNFSKSEPEKVERKQKINIVNHAGAFSDLLTEDSDSQTSRFTTWTGKETLAVAGAYVRASGEVMSLTLKDKSDNVFIAQTNFPKKASVHLDILRQDKINVIKRVSGVMYYGVNLRTNERGQFPEQIFQRISRAEKESASTKRHIDMALARNTNSSRSSVRCDLDEVERINAAEWDSDDVPEVLQSKNVDAVRSLAQKMAVFGSLDVDDKSQSAELQETIHPSLREEINRMLDIKLQKVLNAEATAVAVNPKPVGRSETRNQWDEPLNPVEPKTKTCWFWATPNKDCRYTAEECRDLHDYLPSKPGKPDYARMKPTWGALADSLAPDSTGSSSKPGERKLTCWYWANNSTCNNTAETCKFLHEFVPAGVAPRPTRKPTHWSLKTWKRENDYEAEEAQRAGETSWGEGTHSSTDGWGNEPSAGWEVNEEQGTELEDNFSQKYRPPHLKSLEQKFI